MKNTLKKNYVKISAFKIKTDQGPLSPQEWLEHFSLSAPKSVASPPGTSIYVV